jgi:hypothetical protein
MKKKREWREKSEEVEKFFVSSSLSTRKKKTLRRERPVLSFLISLHSLWLPAKTALNSPPSPGHPGARQPGGVVGRDAAPRARGGEEFLFWSFLQKRLRSGAEAWLAAMELSFDSLLSLFHRSLSLFQLTKHHHEKPSTPLLTSPGRRRR